MSRHLALLVLGLAVTSAAIPPFCSLILIDGSTTKMSGVTVQSEEDCLSLQDTNSTEVLYNNGRCYRYTMENENLLNPAGYRAFAFTSCVKVLPACTANVTPCEEIRRVQIQNGAFTQTCVRTTIRVAYESIIRSLMMETLSDICSGRCQSQPDCFGYQVRPYGVSVSQCRLLINQDGQLPITYSRLTCTQRPNLRSITFSRTAPEC